MGFHVQYGALRILKRSRRLRGRPQWQDQVPQVQEARDTYRIAAKHENSFKKAWMKAVRDLLPEKMPAAFKDAFNNQTEIEAMNSLPLFNEVDESKTVDKFKESMNNAYAAVIQESGQDTMRETNKKFKTKLAFVIDEPDENVEVIEKKEATPGMLRVRAAAQGLSVPVNPYSIAWMDEHSAARVVQIAEQQRQVISAALTDSFERGLRAENVYDEIKANIGLTSQGQDALLTRQANLIDRGLPKEKVKQLTNKYREELLSKRASLIARTETIQAQAQGRQNAWKVAQESGNLPTVERVWISSEPSENPFRPCETCLDLDGKTAPVGGTYDSLEGPIDGPTAHPG